MGRRAISPVLSKQNTSRVTSLCSVSFLLRMISVAVFFSTASGLHDEALVIRS